jgi:antitoxin component of RelBE/YafQ-DinJ toxin-antitoxin module
MIPGMEPSTIATPPALRVTFSQVEAALKDVPVDLLPEVYEYLLELQSRDAERIPNETTLQAMEDVRARRNLNTYQTVDELFEKLTASED